MELKYLLAQVRSHILKNPEVSRGTMLMIHPSLFKTAIMFGSDRYVEKDH